MVATENAQRVIDRAVQIHGGLGVTKGVKVEELYREIGRCASTRARPRSRRS
jgi:acyl-CoA dehydrogenase